MLSGVVIRRFKTPVLLSFNSYLKSFINFSKNVIVTVLKGYCVCGTCVIYVKGALQIFFIDDNNDCDDQKMLQ